MRGSRFRRPGATSPSLLNLAPVGAEGGEKGEGFTVSASRGNEPLAIKPGPVQGPSPMLARRSNQDVITGPSLIDRNWISSRRPVHFRGRSEPPSRAAPGLISHTIPVIG